MNGNRKLVLVWLVFLAIAITFVVVTKISYNGGERASNYQYRISISKDFAAFGAAERKSVEAKNRAGVDEADRQVADNPAGEQAHNKTDGNKTDGNNHDGNVESNARGKCYEPSKFGSIPKISPDGVRVLDVCSASFADSTKKKACLSIFAEDSKSCCEAMKKLGNSKATFVLSNHMDNIKGVMKLLEENGHEFFMQIPTHSSVPENKKSIVSPLLANASPEETMNKLLCLLAESGHAIGVANTTPTLLTKSKGDMDAISGELSRRGVAFFDFEKSNGLLKSLAESNGAVYINATVVFDRKSPVNISEIFDGAIFVVPADLLEQFLSELSKHNEYAVAPVSAVLKKQ
jgi:polysaccharide deacetylase 2 family uncharacterized protein YibQ